MNAAGATYLLEARNARAMPLTIELRTGTTLDPLSVGRNGTWLLDAAGVLIQHAFLYFDGEQLFVQSTDPHVPVVLAGRPIPTQWTRVNAPCSLVFGACTIEYQRVQPAPMREESAPSEPGPDTVPGEPPSVVATLPQLGLPDSERTEVGPPPVARIANAAPPAPAAPHTAGRLAHLASTTPIFEMALRQQQPLGALPATERLPHVGRPAAAPAPPPVAPAPRPFQHVAPAAAPMFEAKPPPWPPPGMLAAVATSRPPSAPPTHEFKPIDPAGPDDATLYAPIPVDGTARSLGTGPYAMPTPGPMVLPPTHQLPVGASQPPPGVAGVAAPTTPSPMAVWWAQAPLPRKIIAVLLPIAVVLAVVSLFRDDAPPPAAKRAAPAAKASANPK